jgi:hypothetical protein
VASDDPGFAGKAADIIGLYVRHPAHAAAFCVDEKGAIQALDLLDPEFPLSPGCAGGALALYSALNTQAEEVLAPTSARRKAREFVDFLAQIVTSQPPDRQVHFIVNNSSAEKTKKLFEFL